MSTDHDFYRELARRGHRAGRLWRLGDDLYFVGLAGGSAAFVWAAVAFVEALLGRGWAQVSAGLLILGTAPLLLGAGTAFKARASRLARRDGLFPGNEKQ